jgi:threonine/homoserine/homoserine lactone efflux protein
MFGTRHLLVFVLTGILLNLTSGQDTMYILGRGIWQGRRAALISALGISSGSIVHTFSAALGLSAILAASATAFEIVKWIGAAYLIYLGFKILAKRSALSASPRHQPAAAPGAIYRQAMLTNVPNPKVALFFMAFLPQFVDPSTPHRVLTFLFLGGCFTFTGTLWCLTLGYASASISAALQRRPAFGQVIEKLAEGLFVLLGVRLATSKR